MNMKKTLAAIATLTVLGGAASCFGAATVTLNNYDGGFAVMYNGAEAPGTTMYQLLGGAVGGTLAPVTIAGTTTDIFPSDSPGFFDKGTGVIPGLADRANADFVLRAWTGAATWDAATIRGESAKWTQATGAWDNSSSPPPVPSGPVLALPGSFEIKSVPEPSTIALGVLGAAALLIRRRK